MSKFTYVRLIDGWAGFNAGDVIRCGGGKGEMLIKKGLAEPVKKQKAVNDIEPKPVKKEPTKVETATADPKAEKAVVTPVKEEKVVPEEIKEGKQADKKK